MAMIHWVGTGMSSIPGLRRLIESGRDVTVWNRTLENARRQVGDITDRIQEFSLDGLAGALRPGDIAVSMLPADWHLPIARECLSSCANFASSSYVSPEMRALDESAKERGLTFVNEAGLDPGIDHLMAHWLVSDYRASPSFSEDNEISFVSYCGGFPKFPNPFRYKFSWSPVAVLKALKSPSRSISGGKIIDVARPWDAISEYEAPLPEPETFEVYPNRDSLPFIEQYGMGPDWNINTFVRGTLRLNGWSVAWADIFSTIENLDQAQGEGHLEQLASKLWAENGYATGEPDRVVLCVALSAKKDGIQGYAKTWVLDAWGNDSGSAMARLVSIPLSHMIEAVLDKQIAAGVRTPPGDAILVQKWLNEVGNISQHCSIAERTN